MNMNKKNDAQPTRIQNPFERTVSFIHYINNILSLMNFAYMYAPNRHFDKSVDFNKSVVNFNFRLFFLNCTLRT